MRRLLLRKVFFGFDDEFLKYLGFGSFSKGDACDLLVKHVHKEVSMLFLDVSLLMIDE